MWLVALLSARADALTVEDATDAWYASETGRKEEAAAWYLAHRDDDPTSARNLYLWLDELGSLPEQRHPSLVAQVRAWGEAHPEAPDWPTALAAAHALASLGDGERAPMLPSAGAWCGPALEALSVRPDAPEARFRVLNAAVRVAHACDRPTEGLEAERDALAMTGEAGPWPRAWTGALDGVDEADLEAARAALDGSAERMSYLARYARTPKEGEDGGPARAALKDLLVERARASSREPRPSRLWAAAAVLEAAGLAEEERAVRERIASLDPDNPSNRRSLERPEPRGPEPEDVGASTVLDPDQRLRALLEERPPPRSDLWDSAVYWSARADAAASVGDREEELRSLRELPWGRHDRLVDAALATGRIRLARKVAEEAVVATDDAPTFQLPLDPADEARWREQRARALDLRARVSEAQGRTLAAREDLEEALVLAPGTPDRLLRLGFLYADGEAWRGAADLLGAALVDLPPADPRREAALARLDRCLGELPGWTPDRAAWLAAMTERTEARSAPEAVEPPEEARFADLTLRLDGEERRLFDLEGPIVLDVWATWCGPCTQSLPHLESLARRYEGRVTFVAVSVDEEEEVAARYLERRGGASFRTAWLGKGGMARLGIGGIPAMFVFDADHRLVEELSGYGPGSTALDEAVEEALAP